MPTTVEQNGVNTSNWLVGRAHFVDSCSPEDAWRISVPDTSSEEETVPAKESITMDPGVDGPKNSLRGDDDAVVVPGTPEPSISSRMKSRVYKVAGTLIFFPTRQGILIWPLNIGKSYILLQIWAH